MQEHALTPLDRSLRPTSHVLLEAVADELNTTIAKLKALNEEGEHLNEQARRSRGATKETVSACINSLAIAQRIIHAERVHIIAGTTTEEDTLHTLNSVMKQIGLTQQTLQLAIRKEV